MRIIAGRCKGRRLKAPTWEGLRPTSDKLRETLFNVLAPRVGGARVLDAYAGTGAVGIEALSRGAAWVTFVEQDRRALALIDENLARCGIEGAYAIIRGPAGGALDMLSAAEPFDVVFLDPPYTLAADIALRGVDRLTASDGIVVLEHARRQAPPERVGRLARTRVVPSGDSALAFYTCQP